MAIITLYQCDVCSHDSPTAEGFVYAYATSGKGIKFEASPASVPAYLKPVLICGQGCATKLLSTTLETWKGN